MKSENQTQNYSPRKADQVSLKELVLKIHGLLRYLVSKWLLIAIVGFSGAGLGLLYSFAKKTNYTAKLSFVVDEQSSSNSSLGAAASIAAQFGFNLGGMGSSGGFFQGDNIIEFLKSRSMIDKTLLTSVSFEEGQDLLVNRYVEFNGLRDRWSKRPALRDIQFRDTAGSYLQDSLMAEFYEAILKRSLVIGKPDKKYNILALEMKTPDEIFSKAFVEALIKNASDFYIQTRTQKSQENLAMLTHQVDSVRRELNAAIGGVASAADANPSPNRALQQSLRVGSQMRTVDVQANTAILTELVKNQQLAKISLMNEKPVIQVLDKPIRPLKNDKIGKLTAIVVGGLIGGFLICILLTMRRIFQLIMEGDLS